jgi:hypothetical protein
MEGDPFLLRLLPAALPIAVYLAWLGVVHLRRRPTLITGRRDLLLLALALAPLPAAALDWSLVAAHRFQALALGALLLAAVLAFAPREVCSWVFYNADRDDVAGLIGGCLDRMGETYRREGDHFHFPERTLRLTLGSMPILHNVVVYYSYRRGEDGPAAEYLEQQLRRHVGELPAVSRAAGMPFVTAALAVLTVVIVEGGPRWAQIGALVRKLFS